MQGVVVGLLPLLLMGVLYVMEREAMQVLHTTWQGWAALALSKTRWHSSTWLGSIGSLRHFVMLRLLSPAGTIFRMPEFNKACRGQIAVRP